MTKEIKTVKCPRCGRPVAWDGNPFRPFCTEKCRLIDLGNWANEEYSIDGGAAPQAESDDELF